MKNKKLKKLAFIDTNIDGSDLCVRMYGTMKKGLPFKIEGYQPIKTMGNSKPPKGPSGLPSK